MDASATRRYELRAELFKALAHPMRLLLLDKLRERKRCVCELAEELGVDKSVASKHLSQMKAVGLVADEKRGTRVEYRLVAPCVAELAACAESTVLAHRRRELAAAGGAGAGETP